MKKIFEGASITSAFFLILTIACTFFYNVKHQKYKQKERTKTEKKIEKHKKKIAECSRQKIKIETYNKDLEEELEYCQKLNDPLWNYFDYKENKLKIKPGKYGVDIPPPDPH